tara:strand:+ start:4285 stop:6669 length:2385 start_codon:yes stop_codon:yes gene_type:complete
MEMKKTLLFILVLIFANCDSNYKKQINLIDLVPTNPILLVKYQSSKNNNTETFHKNFNFLINHNIDSISKRFLNRPVLISYHNVGKKNIQSIFFSEENNVFKRKKNQDSLLYNGYVIKKESIDNTEFYSTIKNGIYIESKSKLLVENSLRNSNHIFTDKSGNLKKLYNISSSNTTLFISDSFSNYLKYSNLNEIFNISNITDWMQFDVEIKNDRLTLNGIGVLQDSIFKKINVFKNISPTVSNLNKIIPINFKNFQRTAYNHYDIITNLKEEISINELKKVINDSLLYDVYETGVITLEKDTLSTYSFKNSNLLDQKIRNNLSSSYKYRNSEVYNFSEKLFKTKNIIDKHSILKNSYGTIIEDILILSKNKNSIENIILNYNNNTTLEQSSKFNKAYNNIPQTSNQLSIYNLNSFENSLFTSLKLKLEDYGYWISHISIDESFVYMTHNIEKSKEEINTLGPKVIYNTKINNEVYLSPQWVTNYVTKKKELIFQDNKNNLNLLSNKGEIIWEKDLKSKIIGEIIQIDLYKNGRLQYAFNTENSFMILDKYGNEVKKVDHKKKSKVLGLSVFDYDKNKNYRFLICSNNEVKMLDSKMKIVKGFNKNNIKHKITNPPKHFRVGSKDYLIFNTEKKLYITDRKGNSRVRISENLDIAGNNIFMNKNSLLTIDNENKLIRIDLNGKISKNALPLESKYQISANNNNTVYISENLMNINGKNIEMKYGNYSDPKVFSNEYIQITNMDENKVYLFNNKGDGYPYFPIYGSRAAEITKNKDGEILLAVGGDKNEILVYSLN